MSSYKGLIIKIQKLKASIDRDIENIKNMVFTIQNMIKMNI